MAEENIAQNAGNENEEDKVISMVDYLQEEQELEEDANAVLGDSDENQCTYPMVKIHFLQQLTGFVVYLYPISFVHMLQHNINLTIES